MSPTCATEAFLTLLKPSIWELQSNEPRAATARPDRTRLDPSIRTKKRLAGCLCLVLCCLFACCSVLVCSVHPHTQRPHAHTNAHRQRSLAFKLQLSTSSPHFLFYLLPVRILLPTQTFLIFQTVSCLANPQLPDDLVSTRLSHSSLCTPLCSLTVRVSPVPSSSPFTMAETATPEGS